MMGRGLGSDGMGRRRFDMVARIAARVETPAYAALAVAVGASLWALCHVVEDSSYSFQIWLAMLLGLIYSFVARAAPRRATVDAAILGGAGNNAGASDAVAGDAGAHGAAKKVAAKGRARRVSAGSLAGWALALALVVLPPVSAFAGAAFLVPIDLLTDSNLALIVFIGWMMVASLFVVGAPYRASSGLRPVPFSAATVPALSLFGLLNLYSVDTVITVCFLTFVAATLYLAAYEAMLRNERDSSPSDGSRSDGSHDGARHEYSLGAHLGGAASSRAALVGNGAMRRMWTTAGQYLVACVVWFVIFASGAALFYYPLLAVLPTSLPVGFASASSSNFAGALQTDDWRSPGRTMELRGGPYPLSDKPAMEVRSDSRRTDTLWRGRVYERYISPEGTSGSHWEIEAPEDTIKRIETLQGVWSPIIASQKPLANTVKEIIRPLAISSRAVYAAGRPIKVKGAFAELFGLPDGTLRFTPARRGAGYYLVHSQLNAPAPNDLMSAPALDSAQIRRWKSSADSRLASLLDLGQNENGAPIREIASAILTDKGLSHSATPARKAREIAEYLQATCEYSLNPPLVPPGQDAVINFLTGSRLGACDMFASSMVLLLRAMDVPARVASGYRFPGDPNDNKEGRITIRERDAHAWVEYYVPRFGWVKHDPTDGTREAAPALTEQIGQFLHWNQWIDRARLLLMPALGLMLLLIGAAWTILEKRTVVTRAQPDQSDIERARITHAYYEAMRLLSRRLPAHRAPGESANTHIQGSDTRVASTAREYEDAILRSSLPDEAKIEFSALSYLFTQAHYGAPLQTTIAEKDLRASLQRLKQSLKRTA